VTTAEVGTAGSRASFRLDIEGLRAIAVLAVVAFHVDFRGADGGFVGVDVFYVISGFLITSLLLRDAKEPGPGLIRVFYARRARRLLPAATAVTLGSLVIASVFASPLEKLDVGIDARAAALFHANIQFAATDTAYVGEADPPSLFLQFWSLSLEEQFYALWPLVLIGGAALAARRGRSVVAAATVVLAVVVPVSFVLGVVGADSAPVDAFYLLHYRAWELGVGALLAIAPRITRMPPRLAEPVRVIGLVAIVYSIVSYSDGTSWPGTAALLPVLGTAGPSSLLLGSPPMQVIGRLSYVIYLWHWPLTWAFEDLDDWNVVAYGVVVMAAAVATHVAIEQPLRRSSWLTSSSSRTLVFAAGLVAVAVAASLLFDAATPDADELHVGRPVSGRHIVGDPPNATDFVPSNLEPPLAAGMSRSDAFAAGNLQCEHIGDCAFGDPSADTVAVVFGDSHAAHWIAALDATAEELDWRVEAIVVSGCTPFVTDDGSPNPARCHDDVRRAWAEIDELSPDVLILSGRHLELRRHDPAGWRAGIIGGIERAPAAARAVVLTETPTADELVPYCVAEHLDDVRPCEPEVDQELDDVNTDLVDLIGAGETARLANLTPIVCADDRCPVISDSILVYRDANHLTTTFAASRAGDFAQAVRTALE
jgi:peptidoglycan/LPS O-acetylase OafA/YrhL